jgi:hypothetical protein
MPKSKNEGRNKMFAAIGLVVAIIAAFLIAAYVSNNKDVDNPNYGEAVVHQTNAKTNPNADKQP